MARVRWTLTAQDDLLEIGGFVARDSPVYAVDAVERLVAAVDLLESHPEIGRVVPEYGRKDLREIVRGSYRIVYLVREDGLFVVRIVHGAQDFRRVVGDPESEVP